MRFSIWLGTEQPSADLLGSASTRGAPGGTGSGSPITSCLSSDPAAPCLASGPGRPLRLSQSTPIGVRVGVLVTGNTYRHPAVSRKWRPPSTTSAEAAWYLGLGAGWQVNEHEAYGIELHTAGERLAAWTRLARSYASCTARTAATSRGATTVSSTPLASRSPSSGRSPCSLEAVARKLTMRIAAALRG